MTNTIYKTFLSLTVGLLLFSACKKDETNVYYTKGTAPVLTSSVTNNDTIPLIPADSTTQALAFTWTNPNYAFSDGVSSQNVTYNVEFDTAGANFTSPTMQIVAISPDLGTTFTVAQLNSLVANGLQVSLGKVHTVQARVVSLLAPYTSGSPNGVPLNSNVFNYVVTPYAPPPVVAPPTSDTLYITGNATPDGWMVAGNPASVAGQGLTRISPTLYTITLNLIGGEQFLLVPVAGDWGNKYASNSTSSNPAGGPFAFNASNNFIGPGGSGAYTVTVNFQTGLFTVVKQ
jgi:starch-binding outer membrane protein SusE/F